MRTRGIIGVMLLVYVAINAYIGLRGAAWIGVVAPGPWPRALYWVLFWFLATAYLVARLAHGRLPRGIRGPLGRVGAYWMLVLLYLLPVLAVLDLVRLLLAVAGLAPAVPPAVTAAVGWVVLLLLAGLMGYGTWRARHPVVARYEIEIAKPAGRHQALHLVLASDLHLGVTDAAGRLNRLVAMVESLKPDLLLLAGDILDDDREEWTIGQAAAGLKRIVPPLGAYAVLGNHEYIGGGLDAYRQAMAQAGIRVLVDEWVRVDDSLYVIGRDDIAGRRFRGRPRRPLADLLEGVDRALPLVLMDHQPYHLEEAEAAGIDLQLSGHTHRGQMFPNHLITRRHFEVDWGYLRKGGLHVIVSLGFGTWGPPVRIGNRPEVVSIRVRFGGGQG